MIKLNSASILSYPGRGGSQQSVLIVDDIERDLIHEARVAAKLGCRVFIAEDIGKGLMIARFEHPDLVIVDCQNSSLRGTQMCRRLRMEKGTCDIPVIFLTSVKVPRLIVECFELEAENYLAKPISDLLLKKGIRFALQNEFPFD